MRARNPLRLNSSVCEGCTHLRKSDRPATFPVRVPEWYRPFYCELLHVVVPLRSAYGESMRQSDRNPLGKCLRKRMQVAVEGLAEL